MHSKYNKYNKHNKHKGQLGWERGGEDRTERGRRDNGSIVVPFFSTYIIVWYLHMYLADNCSR